MHLPRLPRRAAVLALIACLAGSPLADAAETELKITSASLALDENVYELDMGLQVALPPEARQAIDGGLALRLDYEIEIQRVRRYVPDADVAALVQSYEVVYHALSQRYLLRNLNTGVQLDFGTLDSALARIADIRGLPLIDSALVPAGPVYAVRVRALVDMGTAPDSLRWLLFWTDDWSAASEWYTWTLTP
jgi:Domain of unknown function (DUF4390)